VNGADLRSNTDGPAEGLGMRSTWVALACFVAKITSEIISRSA
jgi:hypothetical protein